MTTLSTATSDLADTICQYLSQVSASSGDRLLPERELAERLGVGRKALRKAIGELVEEGILVKRHGSGTYIRRLPKVAEPHLRQSNDLSVVNHIHKEEITPLQPRPDQTSLRLCLWSGFEPHSLPNGTILESMIHHAEKLGHSFSQQTVYNEHRDLLSVDEISALLRQSRADGYLVTQPLAARFSEGCRRTFENRMQSVVYISPGFAPVTAEPLIRLDTYEAIQRGVRMLHLSGYKRIAMIGIETAWHHAQHDQRAYFHELEDLGLTYRCAKKGPIDDDYLRRAFQEVMDTTPDAILLCNDKLAPALHDCLLASKLNPGTDFGLVCVSNSDNSVPVTLKWSRLEFDPVMIGRLAIEQLLNEIQRSDAPRSSVSLLASWQPELTHLRTT